MSGEEWEVEKICDFHILKGKKQYLIKWKDYETKEWVDESNVNCPDLMEEYLAEHREEIEKITQKAENDSKPDDSESKADEEEEEKEESEEKEAKKGKQKKEKKEKNPKKEKEDKPKKEKAAKKDKSDKEKVKVTNYFKYKNKSYYTIEDKNGETSDIPANQARAHYPTKVIEYLESQLPKE